MSTNPFAAPAAAEGIKWADYKGRLLIIEPLEKVEGIETAFGKANAVRANVYVIDGEVEEFLDTLIFPKKLASQVGPSIGKQVLGRLGQGHAKPSQSPPWQIETATPADIATGTAWLAARQEPTFAAPAAGASAPPF